MGCRFANSRTLSSSPPSRRSLYFQPSMVGFVVTETDRAPRGVVIHARAQSKRSLPAVLAIAPVVRGDVLVATVGDLATVAIAKAADSGTVAIAKAASCSS